jgi:iron complex transport system permease protein
MLVIILGGTLAVGPWSPVPAASLAGAGLAAAIVYGLANGPRRVMSTTVLLLAGVTLNAFFSALILFVQYLADFAEVYRATRWLMGDLDVGGFDPIVAALPLIVVGDGDLRAAAGGAQPDGRGSGLGLVARGGRARHAALGLLQRVAGHERGGGAGRPHRLHRHRRPAPRTAARRRRSPHRAAGLGALRRDVPGAVRPAGAHAAGAGGDSGRRRTAIVGGPFFLWLLVREA